MSATDARSWVLDTSETQRKLIASLVYESAPGWVVKLEPPSRSRSLKQNKLQRLWLGEIAEQLGDQSPEEVRGYCMLTIGVPILRAENDTFRERYDAIVKPLPYEQKLALMMEPLDFPVSRLMTTKQATAYLDGIHRHFSEKGIVLTDPGDLLESRA
jgi:hypothetical protein